MSEKASWLARFHETVAELQKYPRVAVTNLWVGEPLRDEEIATVEDDLGFALDDALKKFYRFT